MHPLLSIPSIQSYSLIVRGTPDKVKLTRRNVLRPGRGASLFPISNIRAPPRFRICLAELLGRFCDQTDYPAPHRRPAGAKHKNLGDFRSAGGKRAADLW